MFDIAWSELLLVGGVALIVIGPKELPGALRTAGQMVGKVRRMAAEFQGQFNDAMREAELHDLKKQVEDIGTSVQASISRCHLMLSRASRGLEAWSPLRVSIGRVHTLHATAARGRRVVGSMASDQCNRCPQA